MVDKVHYSSENECWGTPWQLFNALDAEFAFDIDVCAGPENAKLPMYWDLVDDALQQDWAGRRCWMNPPYGRGVIDQWVRKARLESLRGALVVGLLPARTAASWWHADVMGAAEIRLVQGRLKFEGAPTGAPFPSAIAIWTPYYSGPMPRLAVQDRCRDFPNFPVDCVPGKIGP